MIISIPSPQQHYQLITTTYAKFLEDISDVYFDGIDRKEDLVVYVFVRFATP
ncbi:MAG TPA: hypothetical protein PKD51_14150 [Saprospiraceae bacterium]|nr:hypothetical protein [Saprospiraceae bacterium]